MRKFINAYNIINSVAYNNIGKYILRRLYRLRGFGSSKEAAIKSSFLYEVTKSELKDSNLLNEYRSDYIGNLISRINLKKGFIDVYEVSKHKRPDYSKWLRSKNLCTYYENWERLAYTVCEAYTIDIKMSEVVCDMVIDMSATEVECLLSENIQTELISCKTNTDVSVQEIKCEPGVDIKAMAEECLINTKEITVEEVSCENKVDIKAYAELCSVKYNIDLNLVECIISDLFPDVVALDGRCHEDIDVNNTIIEVTEEENN